MLFNLSLVLALVIFAGGLIYKVSSWHVIRIGQGGAGFSFGQRTASSLRGVGKAVFGPGIGRILKALVLDGILQRRVLKDDFGRWLTHILIYGGFILLLLMHALDKFLTLPLFPDYQATLNPFMFLRNLFGLLVLAGVVGAVWRRLADRTVRVTSGSRDTYLIVLIAVIILSGFLLEGMKIVSEAKFNEMVELYSGHGEEEELAGLKQIWARDYGVVFAEPVGEVSEELAEKGKENHEMSCLGCHSRPGWAFLSYSASFLFRPLAGWVAQSRSDQWLWVIHWLACFIGLAYLPFSKMFHMIASPLGLMVNAVVDKEKTSPANWATKQALELDACTHCAACSTHCSVAIHFRLNPNLRILPSEKLAATGRTFGRGGPEAGQLASLEEAQSICTRCYRCTTVCPVGIDLQEMWFSLLEALERNGRPGLYNSTRSLADARAAASRKAEVLSPDGNGFRAGLGLSDLASSFSHCFSCQTCTNVCPVVASFEKPKETLDLLPHQIMHCLGLGLKDEALGAGMVWDCLTCYHCQEACPQGVRVADVLYELRNLSSALREG